MVRLKILNINNYEYHLVDDRNNNYILDLDFFDIDDNLKVGDYLCISAELLNPKYAGYSASYTFGSLENKYGKESISLTDLDVIKLETSNKEIYLKRLYG